MILSQKLSYLRLYGCGLFAVNFDISGAILANADLRTPYPVFLNLLVKIRQYSLKKKSVIGRPLPKQDTTQN
jgi:hypothetical protein